MGILQTTNNNNNLAANPKPNQVIDADANLHDLVDQIRNQQGYNIPVIDSRNGSQSVYWIKKLTTNGDGDPAVPGVNVQIVDGMNFAPGVYIVEPEAKPLAVNSSGGVWGDPHFVGFDGSKFDFQGTAGNWYNILKDKGIFLTALFASWGNGGATVMRKIDLFLDGQEVEFKPGNAPTIGGAPMEKGKEYQVGSTTLVWNGSNLNVKNDEYNINIIQHEGYFDISAKTGANGVDNGQKPDGILGITALPKDQRPGIGEFEKLFGLGKEDPNLNNLRDKIYDGIEGSYQYPGSYTYGEDSKEYIAAK